jgi:hypothetical protein
MDKFTMKLKGLSPLLMHFDNIEAQDAENARGKSGGKAGDDRHPADRWKSYLYLNGEQVVMPQQNILASLLKVGSAISIGGKKTLKAASQGVLIDEIQIPFLAGGKKIARKDVEEIEGTFNDQRALFEKLAPGLGIQVAPCRVNGKRHIRTRPMFAEWSLVADFTIADSDLTLPRLKELFSLAGIKAGLGDWRPGSPSKPGPYGRFEAQISAR